MPTHRGADEDDFFEQRTFSSAKKTAILVRFFKAWASVIGRTATRMLYIDLYCGPGSYERDENGRKATPTDPVYSTPVLVVKAAANDAAFARSVTCIFNDGNAEYVERLRETIEALPERAKLKFAPQYYSGMVDEQVAEAFAAARLPPALLFVDPFGYVGLTRDLIRSVLKDWGTDCVFFWNHDRINRAFGTDKFDRYLVALFGEQRVAAMRIALSAMNDPVEREDYILENLFSALGEIGGTYCIAFRFRDGSGRTKQHLVFTSKHLRGYQVMKGVLASQGSAQPDGVPTYEFVEPSGLGLLEGFLPPRDFPYSVARLANELKAHYGKLSRRFDELVIEHSVRQPYVEKNYRQAILLLVDRGAVTLQRPDGSTPKPRTCPPDTTITFKP